MEFSNQLLAAVEADLYHILPTKFAFGFIKNVVDPCVQMYLESGDDYANWDSYRYPTIRATWRGDFGWLIAPLKLATVIPDGYGTYGNKLYGNVPPSYGVRIKFVEEPNGCAESIILTFAKELPDILLKNGWTLATYNVPYFKAQYTKQYELPNPENLQWPSNNDQTSW